MSRNAVIARATDVAREAVAAAGAAAMGWFGSDPGTQHKPDGSPVTQADLAAERAIVEIIEGAFPEHAVLAEESGAGGGGSTDWRWIVDPLDGTRGFTRGDATWGPLVALEHRGEVVVGAMMMPVIGRTWWTARGHGCMSDGGRCRVSDVKRLEDATLVLGYIQGAFASPEGPGIRRLMERVDRVRCPGDLAGCEPLLAGRAEIWLEAGVRIWDIAAPRILLEEAGGTFTDLAGRPEHATGSALACNTHLRDAIRDVLGEKTSA